MGLPDIHLNLLCDGIDEARGTNTVLGVANNLADCRSKGASAGFSVVGYNFANNCYGYTEYIGPCVNS